MARYLALIVSLALAATAAAQIGTMEFCAVVGTVTDETGTPVADVKVEIRPAETMGTAQSDEFARSDDRPDETMTDFSRDRAVIGWGTTGADGRYRITGVRKPGAYMLIIRGVKGYRRVDAPVSIDEAVGDEFQADLVLVPVGAAEPAPAPESSELREALAAAEEAEAAGKPKKAMEHLAAASALVPDSAIPNFHLARLAAANDDPERALTEIRLATDKAPGCADCWTLQAALERAAGDPEGAVASAGRALELAPGQTAAEATLGLALYELKRFGEAVPHLEAAVAAGDPDMNVHLYLGNCHVALRHQDEAIAAYEAYLEKFPKASNRADVERILGMLKQGSGG